MCISLSNPTKFWGKFHTKIFTDTIFGKYFGVEGADSKILWKIFAKKNERGLLLSLYNQPLTILWISMSSRIGHIYASMPI